MRRAPKRAREQLSRLSTCRAIVSRLGAGRLMAQAFQIGALVRARAAGEIVSWSAHDEPGRCELAVVRVNGTRWTTSQRTPGEAFSVCCLNLPEVARYTDP